MLNFFNNNSTCFLQLTFAFFAYAQEKEIRYLHMSFRKITKDLHPNKKLVIFLAYLLKKSEKKSPFKKNFIKLFGNLKKFVTTFPYTVNS